MTVDRTLKRYTLGEEIFNSVSHGAGAALSVGGTVLLIVMSAAHGSGLALGCSIVYGVSLIVLYTMSTLYHAITQPKVKEILRIFDHTSIFFLIAGSYTPFCLIALRGNERGLAVVIAVWACAVLGIVLNAIDLKKTEKLGTVLYVIMGVFRTYGLPDRLLSSAFRRNQLYRRPDILRDEEYQIHARRLAFVCLSGKRTSLPLHCHIYFADGLCIRTTCAVI